MARTTYRIRGIAPPDLPRDSATRRMFWTWVRDIGLRVKDQELARGLDKDGNKLRPISPKTRKYRRSAMTAARGRALSGPPLMPARELSRTRSLLAGRATDDAAIFYWRFDPFVGDSWGVALAGQAKAGRDVIGLSPGGVARVRAEAWDRWRKWKAGTLRLAPPAPTQAPGVPQVGTRSTEHATFGIGAQSMPAFKPGKSTGGMTWPEWQRYFRQANPTPVAIPGRPAGHYNRLLAHTWGQAPGGGTGPAPPPTPKPKPKPPTAPKPPAPAAARAAYPPIFAELARYAKGQGYEVKVATAEVLDKLRWSAARRERAPAFYQTGTRTIFLNPEARFWDDPVGRARAAAEARWWAVGTPQGVVDHEIGHAKHHAALGWDFRKEDLLRPFDAEAAAMIRELVGAYAATDPGEFVAEVYAGLVAGVEYPPGILDYYARTGGVLP